MVINLLLNTRFLLIEDKVAELINLPLFSINQNLEWKNSNVYDAKAIELLGTLDTKSVFEKYAFGFVSLNMSDITDNQSYEEIVLRSGDIGGMVNFSFGNFLSYLWFVKDNCVCVDFTYAVAKSEIWDNACTQIYNHLNYFMNNGSRAELSFSFDEINYAYNLWERSKKICNNFRPYENLEKISTDDYNDPLKAFTTVNINYHIYNRIERALLFLDNARQAEYLLLKISTYFSVLECLFSTERSDITYKISQRIALYIGNDYDERKWIKDFITEAYDIRSAYVHGSAISKTERKTKLGKIPMFGDENLLRVSRELDNMLRIIMTKIMLNDSEIFLDDAKLVDMFNKFIYQPNYYM